ncbi:hypothetical protein BS50DRAFT_578506 [Corynespora cassiicola Philippines]|uniref:Uncharacterized protein n=1 Tax=Corynespora cassiicola Philippines TaxID=1448308 RepID=A0A2T2N7U2_CORCC|nr:hypothetical protein BS50DRAFT_578506 [Corynespora cassiicola Philippines]
MDTSTRSLGLAGVAASHRCGLGAREKSAVLQVRAGVLGEWDGWCGGGGFVPESCHWGGGLGLREEGLAGGGGGLGRARLQGAKDVVRF